MNDQYGLYLDTCHNLSFGVFDSNYHWKNFREVEVLKSATLVHQLIFNELNHLNLEFKDINKIILAAGPGSYTGMRVSEGMLQIFELAKLKCCQFYHYEIPFIYGEKAGTWITKAQKEEYFIYQWDGSFNEKKLLKESLYIKSALVYAQKQSMFDFKIESTQEIIKNNPERVLNKIWERDSLLQTHYFREIDQEFKKSK